MCVTAYSSTYVNMMSEETTTENCELVIKCLGGHFIRSRGRPRAVGDDF